MVLKEIDLKVFELIDSMNTLPFKVIQKNIVEFLEIYDYNYSNEYDKEKKLITLMRKDLDYAIDNLSQEDYNSLSFILFESYFTELIKQSKNYNYSISKLLIHDYYLGIPKSFTELKSKPYRRFS